MKLIHMTLKEAEGFYAVHSERPFFGELTEFMSSAPCIVLALEKEGAVKAWRDLMGATDPAKADEGTLRKEFATSIGENAVHGSDSEENARIEIAYFFSQLELIK
jgi:nucleoside-diphosphate kinase